MKKIVFKIAVSILVFLMMTPTLINWFGLEIINDELNELCYGIKLWGILICCFLIWFSSMKQSTKKEAIVSNVIITIAMLFFVCFLMMIALFAGMCAWSDKEIIYINKNDKNVKIIKKDYGCGAWDSDPPDEKIFRVKTISKYFRTVSEIDIDDIEKNDWLIIE